jgi:hypothetical protein
MLISDIPILFCADPTKPFQVDEAFAVEAAAARAIGFKVELLDFEELVRNSEVLIPKLRGPQYAPELPIFYRGWMLSPHKYERLYRSLEVRRYRLVNSVEAYKTAHYYPTAYPYFADYSVEATWIEGTSLEEAWKKIEFLRPGPLVLKDWVKSEKHYWHTACFIPNSADRGNFESVCREFIRLREKDLEGGLVFRRFVNLKKTPDGTVNERRLFFYNAKLVAGDESILDKAPFVKNIAQDLPSHFFSIDVAQMSGDNSWIVIETGDGGVSSIPAGGTPEQFYQSLATLLEQK